MNACVGAAVRREPWGSGGREVGYGERERESEREGGREGGLEGAELWIGGWDGWMGDTDRPVGGWEVIKQAEGIAG